MIKKQGIANSFETEKRIETSNFQTKQQEKELLSHNLNEHRKVNLKQREMVLSMLENQIKCLESTEETANKIILGAVLFQIGIPELLE